MQPIEKEAFEKLLNIVPDYPVIRIGHFADDDFELPSILLPFVQQRDYIYRINALDKAYERALRERFEGEAGIEIVPFALARPRYLIQGKLYDFVFVTCVVAPEIRESFLQKLHPAVKNGGQVILFVPRDDTTQRDRWVRLLEENYYVATNTIDDLFSRYDVVISRKMHGWGG